MAQLGSSKVFGNLQVTGNIVAGTTITGTTLSISGTATAATFSGALSGNATTATTLQTARTINETSFNGSTNITLNQLYRHDDRTISPSEITTGYMRFGFGAWNNNGVSPFADYLHLRSYADSSGGNDNLVMFRKDAIGLRLYQQSYGSTTAYASYRDVAFTDSPAFTGQVVVAAGTSAAPAITTTGDTNTGIFFPAADTIAFSEGGTEIMRITSGGSVGIGTDSPTFRLSVSGKIGSNGVNVTGNDSTGIVNGIWGENLAGPSSFLAFRAASVDYMRLTGSGRLGIGTTNPSTELDVVGTITGTTLSGAFTGSLLNPALTRIDSSAEGGQLNFNRPSDDTMYWALDAYGASTSPSFRLLETTNVRLQVDPGGAFIFSGSAGASGQVLTSQGASSNPIWRTVSGGGGGTVTSVDMTVPNILTVSGNPITTSGTLALSLASQNANLVFAGPTTGAATTPTFRGLVLADIPDLGASYLKLTGGTLTGGITFSSGSISTATDATINTVNIGLGAGSIATNTRVGFQSINANTSGVQNTALGYQALKSNTTGGYNVAIGHQALTGTTTAGSNVAIGGNVMSSASQTGSNNVGIGYYSMVGNLGGAANAAVGNFSLGSNTSGGFNAALGYYAQYRNTSGSNNVAIGDNALYGSQSTSYNIAVGSAALSGNTNSASNLIAIGRDSLKANTTGTKNTAIGYQSLIVNTTGGLNTALGYQTLQANTTGTENNAIGNSALFSNTIGAGNVGAGSSALAGNTSGSYNVAIGWQALAGTTPGSYNIALGYNTLINATGGYQIGIGYQALNKATGGDNIGVGTETLSATTSGFGNIAVGTRVLFLNTTGQRNTAVGHRAMENGASQSDNSAFGTNALRNTTGGTNIGIGAYAGQSITTGSNNTIIGSLNGTSTLSSTILIGAGTTERLKVDSTGLYVNSSTNNLDDALAIAWLGL